MMSGHTTDDSARQEVFVDVPTADDMKRLGSAVAGLVKGGDVLLLSGPLGAGKTTFAQGFGAGLRVNGTVVSPTFTIARELAGRFHNGLPAHLVHVDAYRLGGTDFDPGQDTVGRLLDELEALGLDEELEDPGEHTVVLMEWGEQMVSALAPQRLEIHIDRQAALVSKGTQSRLVQDDDAVHCNANEELTGDGLRRVSFNPVGQRWMELKQQTLDDAMRR